MNAQIENPFLQILSLGLIWIFFHCGAMCGPIVSGLQLGQGIRFGNLGGLLLYQLGRGIFYALFGALSGAMGASIKAPWLGWVVVFFMALMIFFQWVPRTPKFQVPSGLMNLWIQMTRYFQGPLRPLALGALFSFLPCMLTFWALNLSASTQSPLKGALIMCLLVSLTSLPLAAAVLGMAWLQDFKKWRLQSWVMSLSFLWTLLVVMASEGWISHQRILFEWGGRTYVLMFW